MQKTSNNRDVKHNNRLDTLRAILASGRISQPALAARLGHSGPTVLQNVRELMAQGLVSEAGVFDSTGGRKAKAFAPVYDARVSVGVESPAPTCAWCSSTWRGTFCTTSATSCPLP